jgi:adenylosuccinate lyase
MLNRFTNIVRTLDINEKQMLDNIGITNGVIFSQKVMLYLIENKKMSREEAYDLVQPIAKTAFEKKKSFETLLIQNDVLVKKEIDKIFKLSNYTKNISKVFKRLKLI